VTKWEDNLPPRLRERLAEVGEPTLEEKEQMKELEELEEVLSEFFKGYLKLEELFEKLKAYEDQGRYHLLREAKSKLEASFKGADLPLNFVEKGEGRLSVELVEEGKRLPLVLELNSANFEEAIRKYPLLVVDCWAPWCAPCHLIAPVIEELAKAYQGKITFGKLNVDLNPTLAREYQIMSIPTLLIFRNGVLVDRKLGAMPRSSLEPELLKHLGEGT